MGGILLAAFQGHNARQSAQRRSEKDITTVPHPKAKA